MTNEPKMKDSGERRTFASGAVRDRGGFKPRPDLISPHANIREGAWMAKGAEKYGVRNYEKGIPISECIASLTRHLEAYKLGDQSEDHAAAIRTNASFILHFEEEIKAGRMDPAIDDMPKYEQQNNRVIITGGTVVERKVSLRGIPDGACIACKNPSKITQTEIDAAIPTMDNDYAGVERQSPTFYIAGPMTGHKDLNFPLFDKVAHLARERGFIIINPAELDRQQGINPVTDPSSVERAKLDDPNWLQTIVKRDCIEIVNLIPSHGDGIILLPGWSKSTGARAEAAIGIWLGLRFFLYQPNDFADSLFETTAGLTDGTLFHQSDPCIAKEA